MTILEQCLLVIFVIVIFIYIVAVRKSNQQFKRWPNYRILCWISGVICITITSVGPIANLAHINFVWHMIGHLLLGMLGPLLLVLSAPMTLVFRILPVCYARHLAKILRNKVTRFYTNPFVATTLNIGGLWLLYTTDLYTLMLSSPLLHLLIHMHIFLAGYLFTVSLIYIDPIPYRVSYLYRTIVFVIALAAHEILSKYIYAVPPDGVYREEAQIGGMLMYYGGDAIDLIIIWILFYQWYKSTQPAKKTAYSG